jgi:flagellar basal body-associated protein FliL
MSDEQQDLNLEDVGAGTEEGMGPRRGGLFSGLLITILKWAAIAVGLVILVVATVVITMNIRDRGRSSQGLAAVAPEYTDKQDPLSYTDVIDQIRGQTADESPAIFLLKVSLGYDLNDKVLGTEISARKWEIQDLLLKYVANRTAGELNPQAYDTIQADMKGIINRVLKAGKIQRVVFREFSVVK